MIKFENPDNGRFYYMQVNRDMLNDLVLTIIRGGRHVKRVLHKHFDCLHDIDKEVTRLTKRRLRRGYILIQ